MTNILKITSGTNLQLLKTLFGLKRHQAYLPIIIGQLVLIRKWLNKNPKWRLGGKKRISGQTFIFI